MMFLHIGMNRMEVIAFVAQSVEATVLGTVRSGFESQ